jgi:capsule polysaccharide export protein KpsE/RkpR
VLPKQWLVADLERAFGVLRTEVDGLRARTVIQAAELEAIAKRVEALRKRITAQRLRRAQRCTPSS